MDMQDEREIYAAEFETQLTLVDDNGVEQEFEVLATAQIRNAIRCICLAPVGGGEDENPELVILRLMEGAAPGELSLAGLEDKELLDEAYETFIEMFRQSGMEPEEVD